MTDGEAAAAYEKLRLQYPVTNSSSFKPLLVGSNPNLNDIPIVYSGPFLKKMTHQEARLILGLNKEYDQITNNEY